MDKAYIQIIYLLKMSYYTSANTQDDLLLHNLMNFYDNEENMHKIQTIVNGESKISLRIIDWFVTNYAKKYDTEYTIRMRTGILKDLIEDCTFKVYHRYKLQLKAYSKRKFDSFCRWNRISIPCAKNGEECLMETTIGQLNFFKWAIDNRILDYIEKNYSDIEKDMNSRNSSSRRNTTSSTESSETSTGTDEDAVVHTKVDGKPDGKTRKKRQELSVSASKCIKKEMVQIVVTFDR
jgi:hypothetical protein